MLLHLLLQTSNQFLFRLFIIIFLLLKQGPCVFHRVQQFHLLRVAPFGVNLPFLLVGPLTPAIRAQNDFRRLAFLLPA